jgi:hypothetical protein
MVDVCRKWQNQSIDWPAVEMHIHSERITEKHIILLSALLNWLRLNSLRQNNQRTFWNIRRYFHRRAVLVWNPQPRLLNHGRIARSNVILNEIGFRTPAAA